MDAWRRAGTTSTGREAAPKNANTLPLGKGGGLKRGHPAEVPFKLDKKFMATKKLFFFQDPMDPSNADTLWVGPPHLRPRQILGFS